eukprot:scaffold424988_cov39-Prasinocladus_malaysianus.AAC.1
MNSAALSYSGDHVSIPMWMKPQYSVIYVGSRGGSDDRRGPSPMERRPSGAVDGGAAAAPASSSTDPQEAPTPPTERVVKESGSAGNDWK